MISHMNMDEGSSSRGHCRKIRKLKEVENNNKNTVYRDKKYNWPCNLSKQSLFKLMREFVNPIFFNYLNSFRKTEVISIIFNCAPINENKHHLQAAR